MGKRKKKQQSRLKPKTSHESSRSEDVKEELSPPKNEENAYDRERLLRIEQNRARMQALGLPEMAASLARKTGEETGSKGKAKWSAKDEEDDEEYKPNLDGGDGDEDEEEWDTLSEGFDDEDDDEDYVNTRSSKGRLSAKANKKSRGKKKVSALKPKQELMENLEFTDEDEALKRAIALSLEDSGAASSRIENGSPGKEYSSKQTGKKGKKPISNRVQMNEDDVVIHFCQFDEVGKGSINVRDLERMAIAHDFTWTDKELMDMIRCFDSNGDGKLTLEDFRSIISRLNMLKTAEQ